MSIFLGLLTGIFLGIVLVDLWLGKVVIANAMAQSSKRE